MSSWMLDAEPHAAIFGPGGPGLQLAGGSRLRIDG
jgi:hypothetical protein